MLEKDFINVGRASLSPDDDRDNDPSDDNDFNLFSRIILFAFLFLSSLAASRAALLFWLRIRAFFRKEERKWNTNATNDRRAITIPRIMICYFFSLVLVVRRAINQDNV